MCLSSPLNSYLQTGPSQYRGRGGRAFRGGRGRGRGGRHFPSHSYGPAISNVADAPAATGATVVIQPSSSVSGKTPAQLPAAPLQTPSRHVWCEICKVECNTLEILEQHKNGKRHKKNIKVHEDLQRRKAINGQQSVLIPSTQLNLTYQHKQLHESEKKGCPTENMGSEVTAINGQQNLLIPSTQSNFTVQATQVQEAEKKGCPTGNLGSVVTADNHKAEKELQDNKGQTSQIPAEESAEKTTDNSAVRGRGLKRKTKGGRGGKCMRTDDGSRRRVEPTKPQQAKSFICEVCNVKCESQVVYDSHLVGKKHMARLKRVNGRQSRVVGLQTHYPTTDINALANAINVQVQQGDSDPQVLLAQLLMTLVSQAQQPTMVPTSSSVAGSSNEPQVLQTQTSETTANVEMGNPTREANNLLLSVPLQLNDLSGSITALSNSITAQIQQGVSDPQVLLAKLLATILSQAQVPAIVPPSVAAQIPAPSSVATQIPPSGPVVAQIAAPSSLVESSNGPQLLPAEVSEITAHVEMESPAVETKNQLSSVPLESDALAGSSSSTQIPAGSSETKLTGA